MCYIAAVIVTITYGKNMRASRAVDGGVWSRVLQVVMAGNVVPASSTDNKDVTVTDVAESRDERRFRNNGIPLMSNRRAKGAYSGPAQAPLPSP